MVTIAENRSIFSLPNKRNAVKAVVLTTLSMYAALGYPWTTGSDLRSALSMPHSLLTLLGKWVRLGYIKRRGDSGYYEYCLTSKGRAWVRSLVLWWPEYKIHVSVAEPDRILAIEDLGRTVAARSGVVVWWGQYAGGIAWNIHSIRGPFLTGSDYSVIGRRVPVDSLHTIFDTDYLIEVPDVMSALGFISDKLGMPPGRAMIEAMVTAGLLTWG